MNVEALRGNVVTEEDSALKMEDGKNSPDENRAGLEPGVPTGERELATGKSPEPAGWKACPTAESERSEQLVQRLDLVRAGLALRGKEIGLEEADL